MNLFRTASIGTLIERYRGIGPGFDLLRLALALAVFKAHAKWAATIEAVPVPATEILGATPASAFVLSRPIYISILPMFFALSGFLVMGSAFRTRSVRQFLTFRALRIFPALAVEVLLTAIILGPLLTALPIREYFMGYDFYRYFGNIFGFVHMELPGLFLDNPVSGVTNSNLWTLPAEFYCYLILSIAMMMGLAWSRAALFIIVALATVGLIVASLTTGFAVSTKALYSSPVIVYYFILGTTFFVWRDRVPFNGLLFAAAAAIAYVLLLFEWSVFIAPIFLTYVTVGIGTMRLPQVSQWLGGDYSYGVYLYGFPITQTLIALFPWFIGRDLVLVAVGAPITMLFAALSWHIVEKRVLRLKDRLNRRSAVFVHRFDEPGPEPVPGGASQPRGGPAPPLPSAFPGT